MADREAPASWQAPGAWSNCKGSDMAKRTLEDRFWTKVQVTGCCWYWTGSLDSSGYGQFRGEAGRTVKAHRQAYELLIGPMPDLAKGADSWKVIDHLCRTRNCVNPDHMQIVTRRVNTLRGQTLAAAQVRRTHCPKRHEYNETNTIIQGDGKRRCRKCRAAWKMARKANVEKEG